MARAPARPRSHVRVLALARALARLSHLRLPGLKAVLQNNWQLMHLESVSEFEIFLPLVATRQLVSASSMDFAPEPPPTASTSGPMSGKHDTAPDEPARHYLKIRCKDRRM